ncbi:LacI family DNA-binding transcriptional regulator [Cerasicoccus fimbriatus]|uniref:LacI family DNA-binding transcriptional regulator n=1 Tax=Cerasicoccus fimbriatus TaxID=3014554 RepID=UPI0022B42584|nr:LacI family DNA-binding transcriptional regulator [Cerasicoccus sp. TK19100]
MPRRNPTLQTIADIAGVSRNTVSCALRADPRISKKTQEKIRRIAEEIGYRPNPMVSALMQSLRQSHGSAKSANLGFVHSFEDPDIWRCHLYYRKLFEGAEQRANEMGYNLTPVWGAEPGLSVDRMTHILRSRSVLGLIIGPIGFRGQLPIDWSRYPMAAMGASLREPQLHRAATYFTHTIPRAWQELKALGYQRVGVIYSEYTNARVDFAFDAGCAILNQNEAAIPVLRTELITPDELNRWLDEHQLDALITAFGNQVLSLLQHCGRRVPEDIGLVTLMADKPPGAYIERDWGAIGAATVDLVVGQLLRNERGIPAKPKTVLIEGEWFPGDLIER